MNVCSQAGRLGKGTDVILTADMLPDLEAKPNAPVDAWNAYPFDAESTSVRTVRGGLPGLGRRR